MTEVDLMELIMESESSKQLQNNGLCLQAGIIILNIAAVPTLTADTLYGNQECGMLELL
jgi:hypothetical protein